MVDAGAEPAVGRAVFEVMAWLGLGTVGSARRLDGKGSADGRNDALVIRGTT